jgi:hypothetical protein
LLDHQAYVASITLAGAAEEILGQANADYPVFTELKCVLAAKHALPEKEVSQSHLNRARNWLKHWDKTHDNETDEFEVESEAIQYIMRGMVNLYRHSQSLPPEGIRFLKWIKQSKLHLFSNTPLLLSLIPGAI